MIKEIIRKENINYLLESQRVQSVLFMEDWENSPRIFSLSNNIYVQWLPSRTQTTNWPVYREKGIFIHCWLECKLLQPLWKAVWRLLKKLKIDLPYDPATPLLRIYPKECESGYNKGTCTPMFIAALFKIAKL
jgi:hypothetical protein